MQDNINSTIDGNKSADAYGAESIQILKGLEAVRKRPGMYIGNVDDGSGLHHLVYEVVDNSIDEALAGYCDYVKVIINLDGSVTVEDNGRGIPVDIHKDTGTSAAEVIMTQLHAGGKFDNNSYKISGGLHGVGVSVVNALSEWLKLIIKRDGKEYLLEFKKGIVCRSISEVGPSEEHGTKIIFKPCSEIFTDLEFKFSILEHRLRELAFLNSGVRIILEDARFDSSSEFQFDGGIYAYLSYIDRSKNPVSTPLSINGSDNGIEVNIAMQWNDSYHENILCFTNNIRQSDGGTHLIGFKSAITRIITSYAEANFVNKKDKISFTGDDIREGLSAIISVKVPDPKFASQTKDKLVSSEVRNVVESVVGKVLEKWLEENPQEVKAIYAKIVSASQAREAAMRARELRRKGKDSVVNLPGKLASARIRDPRLAEIFIVEGVSAAGTVKQGRNEYQAVLSLRGKILNVEKARFDKIISSEEIGTLITALGAGIGEDFDIEKLKYHKIIIMTDADVDGSHIRTLLLTFFYRHMRGVIDNGNLYIAQPPLYKVRKSGVDIYLKNDDELRDYILDTAIDDIIIVTNSGYEIRQENLRSLMKTVDDLVSSYRKEFCNYPEDVFEAILEGAQDNFVDISVVNKSLQKNISSEWQSSWSAVQEELHICFKRVIQGAEDSIYVSNDLLLLDGFCRIKKMYDEIKGELSCDSCKLIRKSSEIFVSGIFDLYYKFNSLASKNLSLQRFKGLGEMNADQLWDTTLDPEKRTLLQVKLTQDADEVFSTLMGDVVEPRKEFIVQNAIYSNVDT